MTLPRTVGRCPRRARGVRGRVASTGCTSTSTCPGCSTRPGWSPTSTGSWGCRSPRPRRWRRSRTRSWRRCTGSPGTTSVPWVDFARGQRKDDVMHEQLAAFEAAGRTEGVVFIGRAQEKTAVFRTEKRRNPRRAKPTRGSCRATGMVNHFYFYCVDDDFGPFFLKFCSYFPYNAKLCLNGNHWAQRQAAKAGIGFTPLDNAFAAVDDPDRAAGDLRPARRRRRSTRCCASGWRSCRTRSPRADRAAGYRYDLSILQAEFSLTQILDRPRVRAGLLRAGDPRQPRHRPPRPGQPDLRPAVSARGRKRRPRAGSGPGSSPRASPRACTSTTSTPRSSSTTRKDERCGPRPPSTTPATSGSANG